MSAPHRNRWMIWVLGVLSVAVVPRPARGQFLRLSSADARDIGFAGAVRSFATGRMALYYNPAAMMQVRAYELRAGYAYANAARSHALGAAVTDSSTNAYVALGLGYTFLNQQYGTPASLDTAQGAARAADSNPPPPPAPGATSRDGGGNAGQGADGGGDRASLHDIEAAMATGYRGRDFSLFVGGTAHWVKAPGRAGGDQFTVNAAMSVVAGSHVRIGAVGYNLVKVDDPLAGLPRQLGVGAAVLAGPVLLGGDVLIDFDSRPETTTSFGFAAQYLAAGQFPVRAGFHWDRVTGAKRIGAGLGYFGRTVSVDVGYLQNVSDASDFILALSLAGYAP